MGIIKMVQVPLTIEDWNRLRIYAAKKTDSKRGSRGVGMSRVLANWIEPELQKLKEEQSNVERAGA